MGERKCKNWLMTFGEWMLPISEAPESFVAWTGLFVLSSVLRRKIYIPKSILGRWSADPNMYIFFIGDAGKVRKSTTMGGAQELLEEISDLTPAPEIITKEDLLRKLAQAEDASMYIFSPEFSEFVAKSGPTMYSFLTNIYDGKKHLSSSTISRGTDFASKPCVNLLAATTPVWISENMTEAIIGGGFASRVVFIFEEETRQDQMFYRKILAALGPKLASMKEDLIHDLKIINELNGEVDISEEAEEKFEAWYRKHKKDGRSKAKLSGYYERRPAHILKVAMCCHVAYANDLVLNWPDFEMAIDIVTGIEKKLPRVFAAIGKNPYTVDTMQIVEYIYEKGHCRVDEVKLHFRHSATPNVLSELLGGLIQSKLLVLDKDQLSVNVELFESISGIGSSNGTS